MPQDDGPETGKDADRQAFREAVAARRERLVRGGRGFAAVLIVLVAAAVLFRVPEAWWVPGVGFVAVAGLAFRLVNWTCPACGERLPTRGGRACRGCGAAIDG